MRAEDGWFTNYLVSSTMHLSINVIGDAFADIYCYLADDMPKLGGDARMRQPIHTVAGGSGLNTSTHLTSLLDQFWTSGKSKTSNVCFQTVVNENDDHGRMIILHCKQHGFTLINRRISNYPNCFAGSDEAASTIYSATMKDKATGHCAVIVSNGDRSFMTHLGCIEDFRGVDILTDLPLHGYGRIKEIDSVSTIAHYHQHVHVAGYFNVAGFWNGQLASKLAEMKAKATRKLTISLVPQQDATNTWDGGLLNVLKYVDFLILSEIEANHITKFQCGACDIDFIQHVANYFSTMTSQTCIIMTLQSKGAVALYEGQVIHTQHTVSIANPVDPTGAGDAFAAGFLYGFLQHYVDVDDDFIISTEAVKEGMRWACAMGTSSIMVQGASVPSRKECIEKLLSILT